MKKPKSSKEWKLYLKSHRIKQRKLDRAMRKRIKELNGEEPRTRWARFLYRLRYEMRKRVPKIRNPFKCNHHWVLGRDYFTGEASEGCIYCNKRRYVNE